MMYISLKFSSQTEKLIEQVHSNFFSEYNFMAKGTVISRAIQIFEESGKEFPEDLSTHTAEPAVYSARVNLTAHGIDFINTATAKFYTSKAVIIDHVFKSILNKATNTSIANQNQSEVLRIMSWNVDWFRNSTHSGEKWEYREKDIDEKAFHQITNILKNFLEKENSVCFLQEIPYYVKVENGPWKKAVAWEELMKSFPKKEYDIIVAEPDAYVLRQSIAIARKKVECNPKKLDWSNNRVVAVGLGDMNLLGVHMPTHFENNDDNDKLWRAVNTYANQAKEKREKVIIIGDFNAYIGCDEKHTEQRFKELLKCTVDLTPGFATFKGDTHIDHILTGNVDILCFTEWLEQDWEYSDHKYIQAEVCYKR